jgi:hypothetical protein
MSQPPDGIELGKATIGVYPFNCEACESRVSSSFHLRHSRCATCAIQTATEHLLVAAQRGRAIAHGPEASAKQAETQRRNALAQHGIRKPNLRGSHIVCIRKQFSRSLPARQLRQLQGRSACLARTLAWLGRAPTPSTALAAVGATCWHLAIGA